jgi:hypothetical protein
VIGRRLVFDQNARDFRCSEYHLTFCLPPEIQTSDFRTQLSTQNLGLVELPTSQRPAPMEAIQTYLVFNGSHCWLPRILILDVDGIELQ